MAYFDRKRQLFKALDSINESTVKDYEIIIVDDVSAAEHQLDIDELREYSTGQVHLLVVDPNKKTWLNSCIPYNIAFARASGDTILIQNPECFHIGDIMKSILALLREDNYLTYQTLGLNENATHGIYAINGIQKVKNYLAPIAAKTYHQPAGISPYTGGTIWYNHPVYRPKYYHFVSAMTRNNMHTLGGFDERYVEDVAFDDNEFLLRIGRLKLEKFMITDPSAVHLYHPAHYMASPHKGAKNEILYKTVTLKETKIQIQELNWDNYKNLVTEY